MKDRIIEFLQTYDYGGGMANMSELVCGLRTSARFVRPVLEALMREGVIETYTRADFVKCGETCSLEDWQALGGNSWYIAKWYEEACKR